MVYHRCTIGEPPVSVATSIVTLVVPLANSVVGFLVTVTTGLVLSIETVADVVLLFPRRRWRRSRPS